MLILEFFCLKRLIPDAIGARDRPGGLTHPPDPGSSIQPFLSRIFFSCVVNPWLFDLTALRFGGVSNVLQVFAELDAVGTYTHTLDELEYGVRLAWRNAPKCSNRKFWDQIRLLDARDAQTPKVVSLPFFIFPKSSRGHRASTASFENERS